MTWTQWLISQLLPNTSLKNLFVSERVEVLYLLGYQHQI